MKVNHITYTIVLLALLSSCSREETAPEILINTINAIDTIETICYKQDMTRSNPRDPDDTIFSYREMYFQRLVTDSIVGVKGHWYMYDNTKREVIYEDIYDGCRLIRRNNKDSLARIYDLQEFPEFKSRHFWSHKTPYGMQFEFKYILGKPGPYTIDRLHDTIIDKRACYQVCIRLEDNFSMPGFAIRPEYSEGSISYTTYYVDMETYYPIGMKGVSYSVQNPGEKSFIEQRYYDINFNTWIDEQAMFDTSEESVTGFEILEIKPD